MSREKYPGFIVTHTIRKGPKRLNVRTDEDGLCEYSCVPCTYCGCVLELLSSSLKACKAGVIHDHLTICTGFTGDRPSKRGKGSSSQNTTTTPINQYNTTIDQQEIEQMKKDVAEFKRQQDMDKRTVSEIKVKYDNLIQENAYLKQENAELEQALKNAHSALKTQRRELLDTQKSVDMHREMGFPILNNGLV